MIADRKGKADKTGIDGRSMEDIAPLAVGGDLRVEFIARRCGLRAAGFAFQLFVNRIQPRLVLKAPA